MQTLDEYLREQDTQRYEFNKREAARKQRAINRKRNKAAQGRYREARSELIQSKGGKCMACDGKFPDAAMDFHHRDPKLKLFQLSTGSMAKPKELIDAEAAKCDLLCKNCHAARHIK
jgi:hypothetical protein